jgi:hypothetical protein
VSLAAIASLFASVSVGYVFFSRAFKKQRTIAWVLYYPPMIGLVLYCTMYLMGRLFGMTL